MKDRNGKTLRRGDVCVFHAPTKNYWAIERYDGIIVEFLSKEDDMVRGQDMRKEDWPTGEWFFYCEPEDIEIIGDVR